MVFQSAAMLLGMEPDKSDNVLKGKISIIGKPFYSSNEHKLLNDVFGTTVEKGDPIVKVWVRSKKWGNWSNSPPMKLIETHLKFSEFYKIVLKTSVSCEEMSIYEKIHTNKQVPDFFPLSWFRDQQEEGFLKEGNFLTLYIFGIPVKLQCNGVKDLNNSNAPMLPFHVGLKILLSDFAENPKYVLGDERMLVKQGILVKKGDTCKHGSKGFNFHNANPEDANPEKQNGCTVQ